MYIPFYFSMYHCKQPSINILTASFLVALLRYVHTMSFKQNYDDDDDDNDDNVNNDDYEGDDFDMSFKKTMIFS